MRVVPAYFLLGFENFGVYREKLEEDHTLARIKLMKITKLLKNLQKYFRNLYEVKRIIC